VTPTHKVHLENSNCGSTNTGHSLGLKNPPRICHPGRSRTTLHGLDRKVPGEIQQRTLTCHGMLCLQLQLCCQLTVKGFKPKVQTVDNEASAALKNFFTANDVDYQLVPPHSHRRNAAERAIWTLKQQFVVGLSSVDPTFLLLLWDRLLPQAEITLNLLWTSRLHPILFSAAHFHGLVDYNKTAPPECKIIAHKKPGKRRTWASHGQHGYSLGPAMHHYRCQNVYILSTASEPIVDTLEFFPHNYQMPQLSSTDRLIMASKDMTDA
jgi:hypothetical protein